MTWAIIAFLYVSGVVTTLALIVSAMLANGREPIPPQRARLAAVTVFWPVTIWALTVWVCVDLRK